MTTKEIRKKIYNLIEEHGAKLSDELHIPLKKLLQEYIDLRTENLINKCKELEVAIEKSKQEKPKKTKRKEPFVLHKTNNTKKTPEIGVWRNF